MPPGAVPTARRSRGAALLMILLAGCGTSAAVHTPASGVVDVSLPAIPVATSPLAVLVDDTAPASTTTYALRLVDDAAHLAASLTPKRRGGDSPAPTCKVARLPVASASAHRVFYLDGDAMLDFVDPDGKSGTIRALGNPADTEVTFSVSPDETRVAVMTVAPTTTGFHEEVAVETLGGAGAVTIFTREASGVGSAGEISWPVGWHGDQLVLADGAALPRSSCDAAPTPTGYDLVDPVSGAARLHFCFSTADPTPSGPPVAAGVLCTGHDDTHPAQLVANIEAWDGTSTTLASGPCQISGVLTPDGSRAAATIPTSPHAGVCTAGDGHVDLVARGGAAPVGVTTGTPLGWLDSAHLLVGAGAAVGVFDTAAGTVGHSGAAGVFVAVLPPLL